MPKRTMTIANVQKQMDQHQATMELQGQLRQAIFDAITDKDVAEIVKKQVEKAKGGDEKSLQFLMKYVLGFGQPVTLQQVNIMDVETAAKVTRQAGIR